MAIIFLYHRVAVGLRDPWGLNVSPTHFAGHLEVLTGRMRAVTVDDVMTGVSHGHDLEGTFAVTFDDGYADNLHAALPLLERASVPATFYVATDGLRDGSEFWWDELERVVFGDKEREPDNWRAWETPPSPRHARYQELWTKLQRVSPAEREAEFSRLRQASPAKSRLLHRTLTADEVVTLSRSRMVTVGSHTRSHPVLATLTRETQWDEIAGSRATLTALGIHATTLSYPFGKHGDVTPETMALAKDAGYAGACSNEIGVVTRTTDPFNVPRVFVPNLSLREFETWLGAINA